MPDFVITSASDPVFSVRLADCSVAHAQSVLADLKRPHVPVPKDLELQQIDTVQPRRHGRLWRFLIG